VTGGQPLAVIENLSVAFPVAGGTVQAVRDVSLALAAGECLAVVGESGSGKSVTARTLLGLTGRPAVIRAARLAFEGRDLSGLGEGQWRQLRGRRIGYVLQDALTSLDPLRRIVDEVGEPLEVHGLATGAERDARVVALLGDVGIPDPRARARQYPHELSGGLRQRALIASALAAGPALLVADEPTASLDVTVQAQVLGLLAAYRDAGTCVLLISHDMGAVARMADRIAVMYAGLVLEQGPAAQVLACPAHPYTRDLLAAVPALDDRVLAGPGDPARPATGPLPEPAPPPGCPYASRCHLADDRCRQELPALAEHRDAGLVRCWHPLPGPPEGGSPEHVPADHESSNHGPADHGPADHVPADHGANGSGPVRALAPGRRAAGAGDEPAGQLLLEAKGIGRRFRSLDGTWRTAVSGVSFALRAGESLGVVGESGSGKSTIARIALGLLDPDEGTVLLDGRPWSELTERERRPRRSLIQYVGQDTLSSFDPRFSVERIVAEGLGRTGRPRPGPARDRVVELLTAVGLDRSMLSRRPAALSGGQRQRVAIARALAPGPALIVCDEPVSALDASIQARILSLFADLRARSGVALLFISHDLGVIRQVCDRVMVLHDGSVVEEGDIDAVFTRPKDPYTSALLAAAARPRLGAGTPAG
jgi:peptide/nickel transport system ATP-binding protein